MESKPNGNNSFNERISKQKYGEELFLRWCEATCQLCYQTGFDETEKKGKFWLLNPILRNIPNYLIIQKEM